MSEGRIFAWTDCKSVLRVLAWTDFPSLDGFQIRPSSTKNISIFNAKKKQ